MYNKNKLGIHILIGAASLVSCSQEKSSGDGTLPNVVFIHVDDLGWRDLGYMGSHFYETPNVDALSAEGMVFTNAYAGAANSAPSRANLLTGQNSPRHGIYTVSPSERGHPKTRQLIPVANTDSIDPTNKTLAHLFAKAGYVSCAIGKWHLSSNPINNGFDINIGGDERGNPGYGSGGYFAPYTIGHISQGPDGEYLTDRLTDEAIGFMEAHQDTSFFLYLSYYTVHTPLQAKEELIQKYREKPGTDGQDHPVYAAMVESMDENIGRVLETIDRLGQSSNTLVVFISDNGGIRGISYQDPLRAGKGSYYEGGIRVPMIMRWPGKIPAEFNDTPVTNLDFFPTFQEILGVELEGRKLDGTDLSPLFKGETIEERPLVWHFPIYLQHYMGAVDQAPDPLFRTRPGSVLRLGNWKLHEYFEDGRMELYNLAIDIGEKKNLADTYPRKVLEMQQMLIDWRTEMNAPVPTKRNPDYDEEFERKRIKELIY